MIKQDKTYENAVEIGCKFLIIHTKYKQMEALDKEKQMHYFI